MLARWDAWLGADWAASVAWASNFPLASLVGKYVYMSSIPQVVPTILALGLTGRIARMERFTLAAMLGALFAIAFWVAFPSFGPSTLQQLAPGVEEAMHPVVGNAYGADLIAFGSQPQPSLGAIETRGLIAFPSYHTVLALLVPLALWPMRWPAIAVNAAMIPAIVVHGGHFAVDLAAGAALAFAVWWLVCRLVPDDGGPA